MTADFAKIPVPHDVFLLRHGETDWNAVRRMQGRIDRPLTERGRDQARRQGDLLRGLIAVSQNVQAYASPLARAQDTASLALRGRNFLTDARLVEMSFGRWEGTTHADRLIANPERVIKADGMFQTYAMAPEAESISSVIDRCAEFLRTLPGPAIIVSHRMTLTVMQALLVGRAARLDCDFEPPQGGILRIKDGIASTYLTEARP